MPVSAWNQFSCESLSEHLGCARLSASINQRRAFKEETSMASDSNSTPVRVDAGVGIFWFIGWLFTIAFAKLL